MLISELNESKLVQRLLRTPLASHHGHHKWVKSTVNDYLLPDDNDLEGQFIVDLFNLTTPEIIDKWYGGAENANDLIMRK